MLHDYRVLPDKLDQKLNTNEDSHKKEAVNKGESPNAQANKGEYQHTGEGLELQKATKPRTPLNRSTNTITKTEVTYMEAPGTERVSAPNANFINEIRKLDAKGAETMLKNGEKHINITPGNLDENLQKDGLEAQKKEEHKVEIDYIERRYCTVCNLEQPIRARHCKHCNKCVACYDHHCPWLGNADYSDRKLKGCPFNRELYWRKKSFFLHLVLVFPAYRSRIRTTRGNSWFSLEKLIDFYQACILFL